jgi:hypothetical protein
MSRNVHNLFTGKSPRQHRELESGDGGGNDGRMEARIAQLESDVKHIAAGVNDLKAEGRAHRDGLTSFAKDVNGEFKAVRGEMKADVRLLFGAIITTTLGLAALMAKGFGWI